MKPFYRTKLAPIPGGQAAAAPLCVSVAHGRSAAAKLREKLGGRKKGGKKGDNADSAAKNEANEAGGDGEGQGGVPPPPHKQARVDGQVNINMRLSASEASRRRYPEGVP